MPAALSRNGADCSETQASTEDHGLPHFLWGNWQDGSGSHTTQQASSVGKQRRGGRDSGSIHTTQIPLLSLATHERHWSLVAVATLVTSFQTLKNICTLRVRCLVQTCGGE